MRDQEFYSNSFEVYGSYYLEYNDSIHIEVTVSQDSIVIDTIDLAIYYSSMQSVVSSQESITLAPGSYNLQVNFTRYDAGILEEDPGSLQMFVSQPLVAGFTEEIVDWSTFQFVINIGCVVFLFGGLGIGSSTKREPKKDETDWKTTSEYEY